MTGGRSAKRKGYRTARALVNLLCELGLPCARIPLSSACGGVNSGDIDVELLGRTVKAEVKARKAEFRTLHRWPNGDDLSLLRADRQDPIAVLSLPLFVELATAARRGRP
jgi:hypothetical protein